MLLNLASDYTTLTQHDAACFWINYPKTAQWYLNNKNGLSLHLAEKSYNLTANKLHTKSNIECAIPGIDHPLVKAASKVITDPNNPLYDPRVFNSSFKPYKILSKRESLCYWQNYPESAQQYLN